MGASISSTGDVVMQQQQPGGGIPDFSFTDNFY